MEVTNNSKALQGVHTKTGVTYIRPGQTRDIDFSDTGLKQAKRLDFLSLGGGKPKAAAKPKAAKKAAKPKDEEPKTVSEVLDMADGNFMAFKSAASKVLGDDTPATKDDIVAALKAKADE